MCSSDLNLVVASKNYNNDKKNICEKIFSKGEILPLKKKLDAYKTSRLLKKGEDSTLDIEIVEGESEIPDRNDFVCRLGIRGKDLPHDLPENTPVELTVECSDAREITVSAYIPLIDMTLNARITDKADVIDVKKLSGELDEQQERIDTIGDRLGEKDQNEIKELTNAISQGIESQDPSTVRKAEKAIKDLKTIIDNTEKEHEFSILQQQFESAMEKLKTANNEYSEEFDKEKINVQIEILSDEGNRAIENRNKTLLLSVIDKIETLENNILSSNIDYCAFRLERIIKLGQEEGWSDTNSAEYWISKGLLAIKEKDLNQITHCFVKLIELLPEKSDEGRAGLW